MKTIYIGEVYVGPVKHIQGIFKVELIDDVNQANFMGRVARCFENQFQGFQQMNFKILLFKNNIIRISSYCFN